MSRIGENIRKITKAWGGKTTGSGIGDALEDLYNNLPFCTKTEMVEIVPQQSVTGNLVSGSSHWYGKEPDGTLPIYEGKTYIVSINDYAKKVVCTTNEFGELLQNDKFEINNDEDVTVIWWDKSFGETITLAIYEEQEVVTPIDIKYLPIEELKTALGINGPM